MTPSVKVPSLPVHAIVWEDAAYSDTEKADTVTAVTIGVILEQTARQVVIASEVFGDKTSRHYTAIPKGMVRRVVKVGNVKLPEFEPPTIPVEEEDA